MRNKLRYAYKTWILNQFHKYFSIGGHCGLCGKWVNNHITDKGWEITRCEECDVEFMKTMRVFPDE